MEMLTEFCNIVSVIKKKKRFGNAYADICHTCINQNGNGKELVEGRRNMVVTSVPVVDR